MSTLLLAMLVSTAAQAQRPVELPPGSLSEHIYLQSTIQAGATNATVHKQLNEDQGPSYDDIKRFNKMFAPKKRQKPVLDRTR